MLRLKKITPVFNQILVTQELYGYDDANHAGIIIARKGDVKGYQKVLAVGSAVRNVKVGDVVALNFIRYAKMKHQDGSMRDGVITDNPVVGYEFNEVEMTDENGESYTAMLMTDSDVEFILDEYEEVVYEKDDKLKIIIPDKKILL